MTTEEKIPGWKRFLLGTIGVVILVAVMMGFLQVDNYLTEMRFAEKDILESFRGGSNIEVLWLDQKEVLIRDYHGKIILVKRNVKVEFSPLEIGERYKFVIYCAGKEGFVHLILPAKADSIPLKK